MTETARTAVGLPTTETDGGGSVAPLAVGADDVAAGPTTATGAELLGREEALRARGASTPAEVSAEIGAAIRSIEAAEAAIGNTVVAEARRLREVEREIQMAGEAADRDRWKATMEEMAERAATRACQKYMERVQEYMDLEEYSPAAAAQSDAAQPADSNAENTFVLQHWRL